MAKQRKHQSPQPPTNPSIDRVLLVLFFVSGFAALLYEIAWLQRMLLVYGNTIYSQSITLAAFLTGISVGALLSVKIIQKGYHPLRFYLVAELAIGIYAIFFYPLLMLPEKLLSDWLSGPAQITLLFMVIQFSLAFLTILIPTLLMGTTLPLLAHFFWKNESRDKTVDLYMINTLGACFGCYLAGFFFLPFFGYSNTIYFASFLSGVLFLGGCYLLKISPLEALKNLKTSEVSESPSSTTVPKLSFGPFLMLFMSGFASILMQIIWTRMGSMVVGPSVYVLPVILTIVLIGIVLGSQFVRMKGVASKNLALFPMLAGSLLFIGSVIFCKLPLLLPWIYNFTGDNFVMLQAVEFVLLSACLLPGSFTLGALFPLAMSDLTSEEAEKFRTVAKAYFLNILGLVIGALIGVNLLIPLMGIELLTSFVATALVATGLFRS